MKKNKSYLEGFRDGLRRADYFHWTEVGAGQPAREVAVIFRARIPKFMKEVIFEEIQGK